MVPVAWRGAFARRSVRTMSTCSTERKHQQVKFGLCQTLVSADKARNLERAAQAVAKAVSLGANVVMLPECFNCPYSNSSFGPYSELIPWPAEGTSEPPAKRVKSDTYSDRHNTIDASVSPSAAFIQDTARKHGIYLIAGSIPEKVTSSSTGDEKYYNTSLVCNPTGAFIAKHRKVHLFDIDVPGKITFKESETLSAGSHITWFDTDYCRMGLGICYDMRFAEYAQVCADNGCMVMCYPGAFNTTTGPAHWELLQRGRALDNQMFVATCSPARDPQFSYQAWGHSSIVDPWGTVIATTGHEEDVVVATIDLARVAEVRSNIPVRKQKRSDLYTVLQR